MQLVSNLTSRKLLLSLRDSSVAAEDTPTRVSPVAADSADSPLARRGHLFVVIAGISTPCVLRDFLIFFAPLAKRQTKLENLKTQINQEVYSVAVIISVFLFFLFLFYFTKQRLKNFQDGWNMFLIDKY